MDRDDKFKSKEDGQIVIFENYTPNRPGGRWENKPALVVLRRTNGSTLILEELEFKDQYKKIEND